MYKFNSENLCFYPYLLKNEYIQAGSWPKYGIEVDEETRNTFIGVAPEGKILSADDNGYPCWIDIPPRPHDELVKQAEDQKKSLLSYAQQKIVFYTGFMMIGDTCAQTDLTAWRTYWQQLNTIDCSLAPNIDWPLAPTTDK